VKAISGTLLSGSVTFLKFALQPYGAVLMAAESIGRQAGKVRLDPLVFDPGSSVVPPVQSDYIDKIVDIMRKRPRIRLVACGEATTVGDRAVMTWTPDAGAAVQDPVDAGEAIPADAGKRMQAGEVAPGSTDPVPAVSESEQQAWLESLAEARSNALKALLIERGIESSRIAGCKPSVVDAADGHRVRLAVD